MAENTRPPVAIRIVRPYDTEDEFLEHELETVGKTSVILIGAHSRPTGVILRFEVTLASGATILRGEGRVLAHKDNAFRGQPGLALRFTRLDPKSKALVDRAAAIREAKAAGDPQPMSAKPSAPPPAPSAPALESQPEPPRSQPPRSQPPRSQPPRSHSQPPRSRPPSRRAPSPSQTDLALEQALTQETPPPPSRHPSAPPPPEPVASTPASLPPQPPAVLPRSSEAPRAVEASEPQVAPPPPPPPVVAAVAPSSSRSVERPANRDDLLARLRDRAANLPRDRVDHILAKR